MSASFGLGEKAIEILGDYAIDQFLIGAARLVGVRGGDGIERQHPPRCTEHRERVDDADGMNADRDGGQWLSPW